MDAMPRISVEELAKRSEALKQLPTWPDLSHLISEASRDEVSCQFSILSALSESETGIYPLPQDEAPGLPIDPLPTEANTQEEILPSPFVAYDPPDEVFTDQDLYFALEPLAQVAISRAVHQKNGGVDTFLEPLLRLTIRRALAEHALSSRHFREPRVLSRFFWHLQALLTSRTYEEILFEKTRRFQVEEVYLLDASTFALVSYASSDPGRHSSAKTVVSTSQQIATQHRYADDFISPAFALSERQNAVSCGSSKLILTALVRGEPSELVLADLEFTLGRIEERFRTQLQDPGSALLHLLQPFLEDCLLIQAPASLA